MAVRGLQDVSASYRFIEHVFSVLQIETARQGSGNLWLPLFSCSALLCCWLLEKSQVSSLSCRISCLTGTSEYVFRLRRQCVGQLGLLIEFVLYVVLIFLRFRGRFFGYCRETSVTSPTCLPPYCLFHLLEWSDILSSCRVSSPLLRVCPPPPHTLPLLSFPLSLSLWVSFSKRLIILVRTIAKVTWYWVRFLPSQRSGAPSLTRRKLPKNLKSNKELHSKSRTCTAATLLYVLEGFKKLHSRTSFTFKLSFVWSDPSKWCCAYFLSNYTFIWLRVIRKRRHQIQSDAFLPLFSSSCTLRAEGNCFPAALQSAWKAEQGNNNNASSSAHARSCGWLSWQALFLSLEGGKKRPSWI